MCYCCFLFFFFQAEDGIRDRNVTGVQTCALPIYYREPKSSAKASQDTESSVNVLVGTALRNEQNSSTDSFQGSGSSAKVLVGTALRKKRIAFVDIKVYVLGVYVSPALRDSMATDKDDALELLLRSSEEKVFCLTFLRDVTGSQFVNGLRDALCGFAGLPSDILEEHVDCFPSEVSKGGLVRITVKPQEGAVAVYMGGLSKVDTWFTSSAICQAFHDAYFGPNALVKGFEESMLECLASSQSASSSLLDSSFVSQAQSEFGSAETIANPDDSSPCASTDCDPRRSMDGTSPCESGSNTPRSRRSWKERSGRSTGNEGYAFGDLSRMVVNNVKTRQTERRSQEAPSYTHRAACFAIEAGADWISAGDVPDEMATLDRMEGPLMKRHASMIRGRLIPEWSLRKYYLESGCLSYKRRPRGSVKQAFKLQGCHIVVEAPKLSPSSDSGRVFAFRIIRGREELVHLSSSNQVTAAAWVKSLVAACRYFQNNVAESGTGDASCGLPSVPENQAALGTGIADASTNSVLTTSEGVSSSSSSHPNQQSAETVSTAVSSKESSRSSSAKHPRALSMRENALRTRPTAPLPEAAEIAKPKLSVLHRIWSSAVNFAERDRCRQVFIFVMGFIFASSVRRLRLRQLWLLATNRRVRPVSFID
eukprot:TRINITY_DN27451_c2_g1_i3.p1 TRINITY_DN27451_c2_g1~~TRINITY_DN27451_c2_g1_i3.p1  ORF type:complete len:658 (-),score=40.17 TRINITY_DN27451_c2_g1_i3:10-1962(-)